jgi:ketosteroid isomerase-like protein
MLSRTALRTNSICREKMSVEKNKKIILNYLGLLERGETEKAIAFLAEDLDWRVAGSHPGAGQVKREKLVASLWAITDTLAEPFQFDIEHITAEDDRVAVACTGVARRKDGNYYRQIYHMLFFVEKGMIIGGRPYLDTIVYAQDVFGAKVEFPETA